MYRFIILAFILIFPVIARAGEVKIVSLVRVIDGDTIVVNIPDWPEIVGENIGVRLNGCDTPELRDKRVKIRLLAYKAKNVVQQLLETASVIELHDIKRGKYFRLVATIFADGQNLSTLLIEEGLAKPYDGGRKPKW